jgi:hypothetical protein
MSKKDNNMTLMEKPEFEEIPLEEDLDDELM